MISRLLLVPLLVAIAWAGVGCSERPAETTPWAALTERGLDNVAMSPGANIRIFNDTSLSGDRSIAYDEVTGYLTLQPGTYRVDGWSLTTFGFELTAAQRAARYSAPGYAFLWNVDTESIEILGSMQDPLDGGPSLIDGVVEVATPTRYYLAHQNGRQVDGLSMQVYDPDVRLPDGSSSVDHAFAQLVIERL